jgi:hypothetical protein
VVVRSTTAGRTGPGTSEAGEASGCWTPTGQRSTLGWQWRRSRWCEPEGRVEWFERARNFGRRARRGTPTSCARRSRPAGQGRQAHVEVDLTRRYAL